LNAALLYALAAAGANLVGGFLITAARPRSAAAQRMLIAFGAGFMLATTCVGMLPEALQGSGGPLAVLVGYLLVHLTQHVVTPHFHFGEETHHHEMVGRWVGITALVGLLLHTFFDGVAIASAFGVGAWLGMLVFVAILLHKIPEGITIASIMLASGNSRGRAMAGVALLGASTVAGVLLTSYIDALAQYGLALSAGVTLYVAASNLIPEVQKGRSWPLALAVFGGAALYLFASSLVQGMMH
jgi:ZIP family zinc transporter/zinc and cadmium transporter